MKKQADTLNKLSGFLFFFGNVASPIKYIPIFLLGTIFNIASQVFFLAGYLAWYGSSLFYSDIPRKRDRWFGFMDYKSQYQMAAIIGIIYIIACIIAPALFLLATWLYAISNLIWAISECHKKENPFPSDRLYSSARQKAYLRYTLLVTATSLLSAISATTIFLFPQLTIIVFASALIIGIALSFAALFYWGKSILGQFKPDSVQQSYHKISDKLSHDLGPTAKPPMRPIKKLDEKPPKMVIPQAPIHIEANVHEDNDYPSSSYCI